MEIKKIDTTTQKETILATRPNSFDDFVIFTNDINLERAFKFIKLAILSFSYQPNVKKSL